MTANESKNDVEVIVLSDLAAICKKLADNSIIPGDIRERARELVAEFDLLIQFRDKCSATEHFQGETLLIKDRAILTENRRSSGMAAGWSNLDCSPLL